MAKNNKSGGTGFTKVSADYLKDVRDLRSQIRTPGDTAGTSSPPPPRRLTMGEQAQLMVDRARRDVHPFTGEGLKPQKGRKPPAVMVVLETASGRRIFGQSGNFSVVRTPATPGGKPNAPRELMDKRLPGGDPRKPSYKHHGTTKVTLNPLFNPDQTPATEKRVSHGKCAEQDALDQAMVLGEDVRGGRIVAYDVASGKPMAACESCAPTLTMHGLEDVSSTEH